MLTLGTPQRLQLGAKVLYTDFAHRDSATLGTKTSGNLGEITKMCFCAALAGTLATSTRYPTNDIFVPLGLPKNRDVENAVFFREARDYNIMGTHLFSTR